MFYPCRNHVFDSGVSSTHTSLPDDTVDHVSDPTELSDHSSPSTYPIVSTNASDVIAPPADHIAFAKDDTDAIEFTLGDTVLILLALPVTVALASTSAFLLYIATALTLTLALLNIEPLALAREYPSASTKA